MAATRLITDFTAANLVAYNGGVAFTPTAAGQKDQLWLSNGTKDGTALVKDLGSANNTPPSYLKDVNGKLLFVATDGTNGQRLWRSDGTANGTTAINQPVTPETGGYGYSAVVNGVLFFAGTTTATGTELWKSDGTDAGTVLVKDIATGSYQGVANSAYPYQLTPYGRTLLFFTYGSKGADLWKSDGTSGGTTKVVGLVNTAYDWPAPDDLTVVGSQVFFSATVKSKGRELWKTDGTKTGTVIVADLNTSSSGSYGNGSYPTDLTAVGSSVCFLADNGSGVNSLWVSDGTATGTKTISGAFKNAGDLTAVGTTLYFTATSTSSSQTELWKWQGSGDATEVANLNGSTSSNPALLTAAAGQLYYSAEDTTNGRELWRSDGTSGGTVLVQDINPGAASSNPNALTVSGSKLYFNATDTSGAGFWSLDLPAYNPPKLQSVAVSGTSVILTLNQAVQAVGGTPAASLWKVLVGGVAVNTTAASLGNGGTQLTLTLGSTPASSSAVDVFYNPPAGASTGTLVSGSTAMEPQTINGETVATTYRSSSSVTTLADPYTRLELLGSSAISGSGNARDNVISGNGAANTLNGLLGNDQLSGGLGVDTFLFSTALNSLTNRDTITDFASGTDKISLSKTIFSALGSALSSSQLLVYTGTPAQTSATRLLFNSSTGVLSYDRDGSGSASSVDFGVLNGVNSLNIGDFLLSK